MRRVILASHGKLAEGIKDAAMLIIGPQAAALETYCLLPGQQAADYAQNLAKEVEKDQETEFVIVVDIYGASVFSAMYPLACHANVCLITGLNLAIVLTLMLSHPDKLTEASIAKLIVEGQQSIKHVQAKPQDYENDEF